MFLSASNLDFMHCDMVNDSMKGLTYLDANIVRNTALKIYYEKNRKFNLK